MSYYSPQGPASAKVIDAVDHFRAGRVKVTSLRERVFLILRRFLRGGGKGGGGHARANVNCIRNSGGYSEIDTVAIQGLLYVCFQVT